MFDLFIKLALDNLLFFGLHLDGRNMFPKQLSKKEESEVIARIANGDSAARDTLIERNLRLVAYIVNKNYPDSNEQDDLISIGTIGLIRAVETFDYQKGNSFSTYASKCIDKPIVMLRKHILPPIFQCVLFICYRLRAREKYGHSLHPTLLSR